MESYFQVYVGPTAVHEIADGFQRAGYTVHVEGTAHLYITAEVSDASEKYRAVDEILATLKAKTGTTYGLTERDFGTLQHKPDLFDKKAGARRRAHFMEEETEVGDVLWDDNGVWGPPGLRYLVIAKDSHGPTIRTKAGPKKITWQEAGWSTGTSRMASILRRLVAVTTRIEALRAKRAADELPSQPARFKRQVKHKWGLVVPKGTTGRLIDYTLRPGGRNVIFYFTSPPPGWEPNETMMWPTLAEALKDIELLGTTKVALGGDTLDRELGAVRGGISRALHALGPVAEDLALVGHTLGDDEIAAYTAQVQEMIGTLGTILQHKRFSKRAGLKVADFESVEVNKLQEALRRIPGVGEVSVGDTWGDGYFKIFVNISRPELQEFNSVRYTKDGRYQQGYLIPNYRTIAAAVARVLKASPLRNKKIVGPGKKKSYQPNDRETRVFGVPPGMEAKVYFIDTHFTIEVTADDQQRV